MLQHAWSSVVSKPHITNDVNCILFSLYWVKIVLSFSLASCGNDLDESQFVYIYKSSL